MGFLETSYGSNPNLSQVNIDSNLNLGTYGITTDGELDINNSDLIGVKRFVCSDYLGAVKASASDNVQWNLPINIPNPSTLNSDFFRVPSNFIESTIKISFKCKNFSILPHVVVIRKYDPNTGTYTAVYSETLNTSSKTVTSSALTVNAGELYSIHKGSQGNIQDVQVLCDLSSVTGGYWEIIDNSS